MFSITKPGGETMRKFLGDCTDCGFSYPEVGATMAALPDGYNIDHNRISMGSGRTAFEQAKKAIDGWKMFDMKWIEIYPHNAPIQEAATIAILASHFGFFSLNASRIVYVLEEKGEIDRYGFAYGTLEKHVECGEERFSVELHNDTGEVWYDLFAFSKPNHTLARIGYPVSRLLQKRFARDSMNAMKLALES